MGRALQILEQQLNQEEMAQMVGGHGNLIALGRTLGLLQAGLIHRCIDHQGIDGEAEGGHQRLNPHPHALEITEVDAQMVQGC